MIRSLLRVLGPIVAFALLSAESCSVDLGNLLLKQGTVTVTNTSADQTAVIAITADDVKSYPTLGPGQSATVHTNVGGAYQVTVVMTPANAAEYRAELTSLRRLVEQQIDGTASADEKVELFTNLAGLKSAIQALEDQRGATCTGKIALTTDDETAVAASVVWRSTSGSGFWDLACGST